MTVEFTNVALVAAVAFLAPLALGLVPVLRLPAVVLEFASGSALAEVPISLAALLAARGLPALLYRGRLGARRTAAAGLLQATSLGFLVVGSRLALELGLIDAGASAALIAAGLLSVLLFPLAALALLVRAPVAEGG